MLAVTEVQRLEPAQGLGFLLVAPVVLLEFVDLVLLQAKSEIPQLGMEPQLSATEADGEMAVDLGVRCISMLLQEQIQRRELLEAVVLVQQVTLLAAAEAVLFLEKSQSTMLIVR